MGNEEIKRELKIRIVITPKEKEELIAPLRDYVDVFTWSYKDMLGLHRVPLVEGCKSEAKVENDQSECLNQSKSRN
jgi:hypothetical protein